MEWRTLGMIPSGHILSPGISSEKKMGLRDGAFVWLLQEACVRLVFPHAMVGMRIWRKVAVISFGHA